MRTLCLLFIVMHSLCIGSHTRGQSSKGLVELSGRSGDFGLKVEVNHSDHVYNIGDLLKIEIQTSKDGFLLGFYQQSDGSIVSVVPNKYEANNRIVAGKKRIVPPIDDAKYRLRITGETAGTEYLKFFVFDQEPSAAVFAQLASSEFEPLSAKTKGLVVEAINDASDEEGIQWESATVELKVGEKALPNRVGVYFGIGEFDHLPPTKHLKVAPTEAKQLAACLEECCNVKNLGTFVSPSQCTKANFLDVLQRLAERTHQGDLVVIFVATHATRVRDTSHDEDDSQDEGLVFSDSHIYSRDPSQNKNLLIDDDFGLALAALAGRQVVLVLDVCWAEGFVLGKGSAQQPPTDPLELVDLVSNKEVGSEAVVFGSTRHFEPAEAANYFGTEVENAIKSHFKLGDKLSLAGLANDVSDRFAKRRLPQRPVIGGNKVLASKIEMVPAKQSN